MMCFHEDTEYIGNSPSNAWETGAPHLCKQCNDILIVRCRAYDSAPQFFEAEGMDDTEAMIAHMKGEEVTT